MKKFTILKLFSLTAFAAAGAFAVANARSVNKNNQVDATPTGNMKVYIDFNGINFQGNAYMHYWGGDTGSEWAGEHLDLNNKIAKESIYFSNREASTRDFYYWEIPNDHTDAIFTNWNGTKGDDPWNRWDNFDLTAHNLFQPDYGDPWPSTFKSFDIYSVTLKRANSTTTVEYNVPAWSGDGYTAPTATSGYRWVVESTSAVFVDGTAITGDTVLVEQLIPATTYDVSFYLDDKTTLYDKVTVNEGGTAVCSKANPSKPGSGKVTYSFAGWVDNNGDPATLSNVQSNFSVYASFSVGYVAGRYVVGLGNHWDVEHGELMSYDSVKGEYSVTVSLDFKEEVKIVYYNGSDIEWNSSTDTYEKLVPSAQAYHYFGPGDGDDYNGHNIKCWAAGSYTFYFTDSAYEESYKSSVAFSGPMTAQHLAALLMGFGESEGHCGDEDRFPAMKAIYLNQLSGSEQEAFQDYADSKEDQFKNAYLRYTSWAAALSEKPWEAGKVVGAPHVVASTESNSLIMIVSVVSLVSASTLVGLIVLKRRKGITK